MTEKLLAVKDAEIARLQTEVEELKHIRGTCIKALAIATGESEEAIAIEPFKHAYRCRDERAEIERLVTNYNSLKNIVESMRMETLRYFGEVPL